MLHNDNHQVPQENFPVGKRNSEITSENNVLEEDDNRKGTKDTKNPLDEVDVTKIAHFSDFDAISATSKSRKSGQVRLDQMRLAVLVWMFLEKFMEIVVVFCLVLLVIKWERLLNFLQSILWLLVGFIVLSMIALCGMRLFACNTRYPGCFVPKLVHLIFLTDVFFVLAIHAPIQFPILASYFALVAAGIAAATYMLLAFICITHEHFCKVEAYGWSLWWYAILMPLATLALSQPMYLYGGVGRTLNYAEFMINIGAAVSLSILVSCEALISNQRFVNSNKLEECVNTPGILPGFVTALVRQPNGDEENGGMESKLFLF